MFGDRKDSEGRDDEAIWRRLKAGVDSGRITEEQARERFEAYKKGAAKKKGDEEKPTRTR